ncbi:hypothetical protein AAY473_002249 [Plecturocebus cupreus]
MKETPDLQDLGKGNLQASKGNPGQSCLQEIVVTLKTKAKEQHVIFLLLRRRSVKSFKPIVNVWSLTVLPRLECSGTISAHYNLHLYGSSDAPVSAFSVAEIAGTCHHIQLHFVFLVGTGFHHVDYALRVNFCEGTASLQVVLVLFHTADKDISKTGQLTKERDLTGFKFPYGWRSLTIMAEGKEEQVTSYTDGSKQREDEEDAHTGCLGALWSLHTLFPKCSPGNFTCNCKDWRLAWATKQDLISKKKKKERKREKRRKKNRWKNREEKEKKKKKKREEEEEGTEEAEAETAEAEEKEEEEERRRGGEGEEEKKEEGVGGEAGGETEEEDREEEGGLGYR